MVAGRVSAWRAAAAVFVLCCIVLCCVCWLPWPFVPERVFRVLSLYQVMRFAILHTGCTLRCTMLLCSQSVPICMYTVPYHGTQGTQVHLGLH